MTLSTSGILLWGFEADKVFELQKKAIRIITKSPYLAHTEPLFKKEKLLKIEDIFKISCLKFYYRLVNNMLHKNLKKLFTFVNRLSLRHENNIIFNLVHFNFSDSKAKKANQISFTNIDPGYWAFNLKKVNYSFFYWV